MFSRSFPALCVVLLALALSATASPFAIPADKKLIEWGWDEPGPAFMRAHAAEMDRLGFDGVIFHADTARDGKPMNFAWECWGTKQFAYSDFASTLTDLKACNFKRMTELFLRFNVCPGEVDWFDDQAFAVVLNNAKLAARVAKEGGCRGWMFDVEMYGKPLFGYRDQAHRDTLSFAEYEAKVRQRGKQFIQAVGSEYPDMTMLLTYAYSITGLKQDRSKAPYGLLKAFLDGMFEGVPAPMKIVDGWEGAYSYRKRSQFRAAYDMVKHKLIQECAFPDQYRKHMSAAFGLWMDMDFRRYGWHTNVADFDANYFTPDEFAYSVNAGLLTTDKYVWIYTEKPLWWTHTRCPVAYRKAIRQARYALPDRDAEMGRRAIKGDTGAKGPTAAAQPNVDDQSLFGDLKETYHLFADLPKVWKFSTDPKKVGVAEKWFAPEYDAAKWRTMEIGKFWDEQGVQFAGTAWYRIEWDTPQFEAPAGKDVVLWFGAVDETAVVYVNGVKAGVHDEGADYGWDKRFPIKVTNLLKPGQKNVIAVQVGNDALAGGIWKNVKLAVAR